MLDEGAQQQLVVTDGVSDQLRLHHKIMKLERREVGQGMALGITPDQFDRVEFRRVRWQQISTYIAAMIGKPTGDWLETIARRRSQTKVSGTRKVRRSSLRNAKIASPS